MDQEESQKTRAVVLVGHMGNGLPSMQLAKCQWERLAGFLSQPFLSDSWQETHNMVNTFWFLGKHTFESCVLYPAIICYRWPAGFCQHLRSLFEESTCVSCRKDTGNTGTLVFLSSRAFNYNQKTFFSSRFFKMQWFGVFCFLFFLCGVLKFIFPIYVLLLALFGQNMERKDKKKCKNVASGSPSKN